MTLGNRQPLAIRLRDELLKQATDESWQVGERIPSEHAIAEMFGVGRTTVREALKLLEQDGYVRSQQGKGRFLAVSLLDRPLTRLEGVTEMMEASGLAVTNRVLTCGLAPATDEQAESLGLNLGAELVRLERARYHQDSLLIYSVDYFRDDLLDKPIRDLDFTQSLFGHLQAAGVEIDRAVAVVQAIGELPNPDLDVSGPWLVLNQEHVDTNGHTVLLSSDYHKSGAFTFRLIRRRDV